MLVHVHILLCYRDLCILHIPLEAFPCTSVSFSSSSSSAHCVFGHGAQKLLGWFGGFGVDGTAGYMESIGAPRQADGGLGRRERDARRRAGRHRPVHAARRRARRRGDARRCPHRPPRQGPVDLELRRRARAHQRAWRRRPCDRRARALVAGQRHRLGRPRPRLGHRRRGGRPDRRRLRSSRCSGGRDAADHPNPAAIAAWTGAP